VPPSVEVTAWVVLIFGPGVVARTCTLTVQEFPGVAMLPPERLMLVAPAVGAKVPPQVLTASGAGATSSPAGNGSVMPMPVGGPGLAAGLLPVSVSVLTPFPATLFGANALVTLGGDPLMKTSRVAVAVPPGPVSFEVTASVVLTFGPA